MGGKRKSKAGTVKNAKNFREGRKENQAGVLLGGTAGCCKAIHRKHAAICRTIARHF